MLKPLIDLVHPILFNRSPEGYTPDVPIDFKEETFEEFDYPSEEFGDLQLDQEVTPNSQILTCFCWRILKEYNELVAVIFKRIEIKDFSIDLLIETGVQIKTMLLYIIHKGSFISLYETFRQICQRFITYAPVSNIPFDWLQDLTNKLSSVEDILSVTRRSGGLPFLYLALVTTINSHQKNRQILSFVVVGLVNLFNAPTSCNELKIHILNILRLLFKDSTIGNDISPHTTCLLKLVVAEFSSSQ